MARISYVDNRLVSCMCTNLDRIRARPRQSSSLVKPVRLIAIYHHQSGEEQCLQYVDEHPMLEVEPHYQHAVVVLEE
jgi:hypothetical protein